MMGVKNMVMIYRTIIMFAIIIVSMRLMGKRQIGELELNELVVAVMISELATIPITDESKNLLDGVIPVVTLLLCELIVTFIAMKSVKFRSILSGNPSIILKNGQVNQREMKKNRFTMDELIESLRTKDITDISTVRYAILETDGTLSTILFKQHSPATHNAMGVEAEDNGLPMLLINDGRILKNNLKLRGLDENWLKKELQNRKISSPKDVFLLSVDDCGNIYFAPKE